MKAVLDIPLGLALMLLTWTLAPVVLVIALGLGIRALWPRKPGRAYDEHGVTPPKQTIF